MDGATVSRTGTEVLMAKSMRKRMEGVLMLGHVP